LGFNSAFKGFNTTGMSNLKNKMATGNVDVRIVVFLCLVNPGAKKTVLAS
jgi:hypothetical protein